MSKFCSNCGKELNEEQDICLNCGQMVKKSPRENNQMNTTNGLAIAGFVLSIIGFVLSIFIVGIFFCIVGLVLSIIGLTKTKSLNGSGKGLAISGIIINSIVIVIFSFLIIFGFAIWTEIEETTVQHTCNTYGSNYKAVQGHEIIGSYDEDDWYCCKAGKTYSIRNCYRAD